MIQEVLAFDIQAGGVLVNKLGGSATIKFADAETWRAQYGNQLFGREASSGAEADGHNSGETRRNIQPAAYRKMQQWVVLVHLLRQLLRAEHPQHQHQHQPTTTTTTTTTTTSTTSSSSSSRRRRRRSRNSCSCHREYRPCSCS
jgi:hypothetical protein